MDYINYNGKDYPVVETGFGLVSTDSLEQVLMADMSDGDTDKAIRIDDQFVFYVPDDMMARGDQQEITEYVKKECGY